MTPLEFQDLLSDFARTAAPEALHHVSQSEAQLILERARALLGVAPPCRWWWEHCGPRMHGFAHAGPFRFEGLEALAHDGLQSVYLFASDDEYPPWPCVKGSIQAVCALINESPNFELVLVAENLEWIVLESHHNTVFVWPVAKGGQMERALLLAQSQP